MGENFSVTFSTLKESPHLRSKTINLIEESFNYTSNFSFATDFYPLMSLQNAQHNHLLLHNNQVIAHIGCLKRTLSGNHPILLIGGIAVNPQFRGKGMFAKLFKHILQIYQKEVSLFMLWSDKVELYQKFDFSLAIGQIAPNNSTLNLKQLNVEKRSWSELTPTELKEIKDLYNALAIHYTIIERDDKHWDTITQINSTDLYLQRDEEQSIISYFVCNKGFDLQNIIHEVAFFPSNKTSLLKKLSDYNLWLPEAEASFYKNPPITYMAMIKIGNFNLFQQFINDWSNKEINITQYINQKIIFTFQTEEFSASPEEFFQYIWGPYPLATFKEIGLPIYISGLDSI